MISVVGDLKRGIAWQSTIAYQLFTLKYDIVINLSMRLAREH
jgi:hypothetical protein